MTRVRCVPVEVFTTPPSHHSAMSGDHTEEIALILRCENGNCARGELSGPARIEQDQNADDVATTSPARRGQTTPDDATRADASTACKNGSVRTETTTLCRNNRRIIHDQAGTGVHEQAIDTAGFGEFQWRFFVVLAMALVADGSEMTKMSHVIDSAERAFCMTRAMKTSLGRPPVMSLYDGRLVPNVVIS